MLIFTFVSHIFILIEQIIDQQLAASSYAMGLIVGIALGLVARYSRYNQY